MYWKWNENPSINQIEHWQIFKWLDLLREPTEEIRSRFLWLKIKESNKVYCQVFRDKILYQEKFLGSTRVKYLWRIIHFFKSSLTSSVMSLKHCTTNSLLRQNIIHKFRNYEVDSQWRRFPPLLTCRMLHAGSSEQVFALFSVFDDLKKMNCSHCSDIWTRTNFFLLRAK